MRTPRLSRCDSKHMRPGGLVSTSAPIFCVGQYLRRIFPCSTCSLTKFLRIEICLAFRTPSLPQIKAPWLSSRTIVVSCPHPSSLSKHRIQRMSFAPSDNATNSASVLWHNCQRLLYTIDLQLDLDLAVRYGRYSARASTRVRHVFCQPNG